MEDRLSKHSWQLLLSLSLVWGFSFLFNALLLDKFSVIWLVFFRLFIGGLLSLFVMTVLGHRIGHNILELLKMIGQGLLGVGIPFSIIVWAQYNVASGYTSVLVASAPLFGMVFSGLSNVGDPMVARKLIGVCIGMFGVGVMLSENWWHQGFGDNFFSQASIIVACCFYAAGSIYTRRFRLLRHPPSVICTGTLLGGSLVMLPIALLVDGVPNLNYFLDLKIVFSLLSLGAICTGVAYLLFYPLLQRAGSSVFLCTLISPWIALLAGNVFLSEPFEWIQIIGMMIIVFALLLVDGRIVNLMNTLMRRTYVDKI